MNSEQMKMMKAQREQASASAPPALKCKICNRLYCEPVSMLCMHTFCMNCVGKLQQTIEFTSVECPLCMQSTDIEPDYLPKNLDIKKKVDDYLAGTASYR